MPRPTRYRRLRIPGASRFALRASSDGDTYLVVVTDNLSTPSAAAISFSSSPPAPAPRLHDDDADRAVEVMIGRAGFPGRTADR